jgi:hypothetical protein
MVRIEMKGKVGVITTYNITIRGKVKANMDLRLVARREFGTPLYTILAVPLVPVNVPGLMSIIPEFRVNAGVHQY